MRPVVIRPKVELKTLVNEITDSETYKITEADGRSYAEHSHEQLIAKLQRIISLAMYNRDRSESVDKQIRRLDELCQMPQESVSVAWQCACVKRDRSGVQKYLTSYRDLSPCWKIEGRY